MLPNYNTHSVVSKMFVLVAIYSGWIATKLDNLVVLLQGNMPVDLIPALLENGIAVTFGVWFVWYLMRQNKLLAEERDKAVSQANQERADAMNKLIEELRSRHITPP